MSEEDTTPTAPAATEATENGAAGADTKPESKGPRRKKEDEKPIEELYDLSKPIPRVRKHNDTYASVAGPAIFVCCCFVSSLLDLHDGRVVERRFGKTMNSHFCLCIACCSFGSLHLVCLFVEEKPHH